MRKTPSYRWIFAAGALTAAACGGVSEENFFDAPTPKSVQTSGASGMSFAGSGNAGHPALGGGTGGGSTATGGAPSAAGMSSSGGSGNVPASGGSSNGGTGGDGGAGDAPSSGTG